MNPNILHLPDGSNLLRTQAGFKKLVRQLDPNKEYLLRNYPTSYPCVAYHTLAYDGGGYSLSFKFLTVEQVRSRAEHTLNMLKNQ